jgi:hypothetical protein
VAEAGEAAEQAAGLDNLDAKERISLDDSRGAPAESARVL